MQADVPTAAWRSVRSLAEGLEAVAALLGDGGVVIKADGLAAGKGVTVAGDATEAEQALREIFLDGRFGGDAPPWWRSAWWAMSSRCWPSATACGRCRWRRRATTSASARAMRARTPAAWAPTRRCPTSTGADVEEIVAHVHQPIVDLMRSRGTPFHGVLYAGPMLTPSGPRVIEFNVRFGDPETQALLPRLRSDLLALLRRATKTDGLADVELEWSASWAVSVVLASAGYPESSSSGDLISGLDDLDPAVEVTHAGTALRDGELVTAGGRVLNVTALGADIGAARAAAYAAADMVTFPGRQLRRDIALSALRRSAALAEERA